jgi:hypothetical protein
MVHVIQVAFKIILLDRNVSIPPNDLPVLSLLLDLETDFGMENVETFSVGLGS